MTDFLTRRKSNSAGRRKSFDPFSGGGDSGTTVTKENVKHVHNTSDIKPMSVRRLSFINSGKKPGSPAGCCLVS